MRRLLPLLTLAALLSACVGQGIPSAPTSPAPQPGTTSAPQAGEVTISFAVWDYERPTYEPLIDTFEAEHPNINVVMVPLDDLMGGPASGSPAGPESPTAALRRMVSAADTLPAIGYVPEAFGSPLLLDLAPLMEADPNFNRDDFYPGALERWTIKGGTWAVPRSFYLQVLSYNKDLFQAANVPAPQAGWSWDDLIASATQVSAANSGAGAETYGFLDNSGGFLPFITLLKEEGLDITTLSSQELRLDDERIVRAIERVRELYRERVFFNPYPASPDAQPIDPGVVVSEGRLAIWGDVYISGPDGQPAEPQGISIGRVPMPTDGWDLFGGPGGDGFFISGGTAYPQESWTWIEWLSRQQISQPNAGPAISPGQVPARKSVAEASGFWNDVDEETAAAYRWALENSAPPSSTTPDYLTFGALSQAVATVVSDPKKETSAAIDEAQTWLDEQIVESATTPTPAPDLSPVLVATPEPQQAPDGATTIRFSVVGYSPTEIRRLARAFREQRPDIFVQLQNTEVFTQPPQLAQVAQTADCFAWTGVPASEADYAALLDLQPLIDADGSFPLDDFPPALLGAYQRNGGTFGLPYAFSLRNLVYNRTAFDTAGIQPPTGAWTPQDFLAAAQALSSGEGANRTYGYVPLGSVQADLLFFVGRFGGRLTTGSGQDLRPNYTDPKTVEAIQWYLDLARVHGVMPEPKLQYRRDDPGSQDPSYELVQNGRAGMWFDYGRGMFGEYGGDGPGRPEIESPERPFEVAVAPLPVGTGGLRSGDYFVRGGHISAGAEQPQACWEFLKFMSGDTTLVYGDFPARISVATGEQHAAAVPVERLEVYRAYEDVLRRPSEPGEDSSVLWTGQLDTYWLYKAIMEAVEKDADLAIGLEEAQRATTTFMECVAQGGKPSACALEADPDYQGFMVETPEGEGVPRG
jgi:multiple sugar transport system substrate-binding protein